MSLWNGFSIDSTCAQQCASGGKPGPGAFGKKIQAERQHKFERSVEALVSPERHVMRKKMKNRIYPLIDLEIPMPVIEEFGPFEQFRQDVSMVSVELKNGKIITGVLIVYPNYVGSIEGEEDLIFSPKDVVRVFQTPEDLKKRSKSNWSWLYDPGEFSRL